MSCTRLDVPSAFVHSPSRMETVKANSSCRTMVTVSLGGNRTFSNILPINEPEQPQALFLVTLRNRPQRKMAGCIVHCTFDKIAGGDSLKNRLTIKSVEKTIHTENNG